MERLMEKARDDKIKPGAAGSCPVFLVSANSLIMVIRPLWGITLLVCTEGSWWPPGAPVLAEQAQVGGRGWGRLASIFFDLLQVWSRLKADQSVFPIG
jgi:hypothetical protein